MNSQHAEMKAALQATAEQALEALLDWSEARPAPRARNDDDIVRHRRAAAQLRDVPVYAALPVSSLAKLTNKLARTMTTQKGI